MSLAAFLAISPQWSTAIRKPAPETPRPTTSAAPASKWQCHSSGEEATGPATPTVIPLSEVRKLLLQIHGILDKAVSKWVGTSARILAHLFNSVSRQCREVWASQFPFLHSLKEVVPPSEACLYGRINWSLAQAHSVGLSQSFPPKRGGKARSRTGFHFTVQKRPVSGSVPGTSGAPLPKRPHLESGNEAHPHGKKSADGAVSTRGRHPQIGMVCPNTHKTEKQPPTTCNVPKPCKSTEAWGAPGGVCTPPGGVWMYRGHTNVWGHTNIQGGCTNMGVCNHPLPKYEHMPTTKK